MVFRLDLREPHYPSGALGFKLPFLSDYFRVKLLRVEILRGSYKLKAPYQ